MFQQDQKIFNGKLNLDDSRYLLAKGDYVDALNITRGETGKAFIEGQDLVISNIAGNQIITYSLPTGINKKVGAREDLIRNRVYYMIWNSGDHDLILFYDRKTGTITKVIENIADTGAIDVLNFNPSFRINHIDIIYKDDGDLLSWTDGNSTPKEINVTRILNNTYSLVKTQFIEAAKRPPLSRPLCAYGTDAAKTSNSLRKKLFMFTHRFYYHDYYKSSYSSWSKVALPVGFYGSDNDIDNTKNNFITVTVETGDENVQYIEISVRENDGSAWKPFVPIVLLNKAEMGIPNNTTYNFLFYNDALYPPQDQLEVMQLFDWVPQNAYAQVLLNGNVKGYAGITEGYDNIPRANISVNITAVNKTNNPPDTVQPAISYVKVGNIFTFTVTGPVITGTVYTVAAWVNYPFPGIPAAITLATYTAIGGDTLNSVATGMYNYILAHTTPLANTNIGATFSANLPAGSTILHIDINKPGAGGGAIATEKTWLHDCNLQFGIVYQDEQNRDMPGVITFTNPADPDNDFSLTTPSFSQSGGSMQTPVITALINSLPPVGAVRFRWVRRRMTYANFLQYETCDFQDPGDGFLYFCLGNISQYKTDNSQFIYASAPITSESRLKVVAGITSGTYNSNIWNQDYQILSTVIRRLTGGSTTADDKTFIKVKKPLASVSPAYTVNMLVMVYTPMLNPTEPGDSVYWEFGEEGDIYTLSGVRYHRGKSQDQTGAQPAIFVWEEGDVYFHSRAMYKSLLSTPAADSLSVMDAGFSDFFLSSVNDNGRAQPIEMNAKKTYFPTLIRFSEAYQQGTNINGNNRFFYDNFDEYDRSNGDIRKLYVEGRYLYVFQKFDIGVVPILTQIVRDVTGNPLEANSDKLLNKITYPYKGKVGIGDVPESFAAEKYAKYGCDNNKGVVWRLSQDGIIILSVLYKTNSFFAPKLAPFRKDLNNGIVPAGQIYAGDPTVDGCFDSANNRYILTLEEINRYSSPTTLSFHQDAVAINFLETRDSSEGFETFLSYNKNEGMVCLGNLLISFKDGALWTHDSAIQNNFYGVQYDSYIKGVFNDHPSVKKTYEGVSYQGNQYWVSDVNGDILTSQINDQTGLAQISNLKIGDFTKEEGKYIAALLRDANSMSDAQLAVCEGDYLKGVYMVWKMKYVGSQLAILLLPTVYYSISQKNP